MHRSVGAEEGKLIGDVVEGFEEILSFLQRHVSDGIAGLSYTLERLSVARVGGRLFIRAALGVVAERAELRIFLLQRLVFFFVVRPGAGTASGVEESRHRRHFGFDRRCSIERAVLRHDGPLEVLQEFLSPPLVTLVVEAGMAEVNSTQAIESTGVFASDDGDRLEIERLRQPLVVTNFLDDRQALPPEGGDVKRVLRRENSKLGCSIANPLSTLDGVLSVDAINFRVSSAERRKISKTVKKAYELRPDYRLRTSVIDYIRRCGESWSRLDLLNN